MTQELRKLQSAFHAYPLFNQVLSREDDQQQWRVIDSTAVGDCSGLRVVISHFTQFTLGDALKKKQAFVKLTRDVFNYRFFSPGQDEEIFELSRRDFGVWNASDHPTTVYVYLLPTTWEKKRLKDFGINIGPEQFKIGVNAAFVYDRLERLGSDPVITDKMEKGFRAAMNHSDHRGTLLIVTLDDGEASLWGVRSVRRGDCLVLLPSCFVGTATDTQPCSKTTNMMKLAVSMYLAGREPLEENDGLRTPATAMDNGEEKSTLE